MQFSVYYQGKEKALEEFLPKLHVMPETGLEPVRD